MSRDPRYLLPLAILIGVIVVSAALVERGRTSAKTASPAAPAVSVTAIGDAPAAEATPRLDDQFVDARRALDLVQLRDALAEYRKQHNGYPSTDGAVTTLCATPSDAGCALSSIMPDAPFGDDGGPYWYVSDGRNFATLIAIAKLPHVRGQNCPRQLPPALSGGQLICVSVPRGG